MTRGTKASRSTRKRRCGPRKTIVKVLSVVSIRHSAAGSSPVLTKALTYSSGDREGSLGDLDDQGDPASELEEIKFIREVTF